MASSQLVHIAEGESMSAESSELGQAWHIAATLLQDHTVKAVHQLLLALLNAENERKHKSALTTVARRIGAWV